MESTQIQVYATHKAQILQKAFTIRPFPQVQVGNLICETAHMPTYLQIVNTQKIWKKCTTRSSVGQELNKQDCQTRQAIEAEMGGKFMIWAPYTHKT